MIKQSKKGKIKEQCSLIIEIIQHDFKKVDSCLYYDNDTITLKNNGVTLLVVEFLKENGIDILGLNNNIIATDSNSIDTELEILQDNNLDITIFNIPGRAKFYYNSNDLNLFYTQLKHQTRKVLTQCSN